MGYGPWGHKEWDMTEQLSMHTCMSGEKTPCLVLFSLPSLLTLPSLCGGLSLSLHMVAWDCASINTP